MDDEVTSLVRRVQGRDLAAFDQLVRRFQGRALAYARSLLREGADAEDAAQDAFVLLWRELPSLREPAAFPSFLRRLVFKCADRIRRRPSVRGISFDPAGHADGAELSGGSDPVFGVIRSDEGRRVRDAVLALPEAERQAAMLYYFGEHDLAAIADFLGVPRTTVKNRLHAARKRLRKELWDMSEEAMSRRTRSSRGDAFTRSVLVRAVDEYRRQKHADPHVADRELLRAGREALEESLAGSGPLDDEDARAGFHLLIHQDDRKAQARLLMRYLAQELDDGHRAWALLHLSNALACGGEPAGAVLAHEALEAWLPGRDVRLASAWPYLPLAAAEREGTQFATAEVLLLALGKSGEFANAWVEVWRREEYLAKVDVALHQTPATERNRGLHAACMRMACLVLERAGEWDRARTWVDRMYALADRVPEPGEQGRWRARAFGHEVRLLQSAGDLDAMRLRAEEADAHLSRFEERDWVPGERHNLACQCAAAGDFAFALELFEKNVAAGGQVNGWGWLVYAAAVWRVTGSRERTLALLREAAARDDRDLTAHFQTGTEFADMAGDPEFLAALRRPE